MSGKLLYQLQLRLKKNAVNKTRKKEEINGLKKIFNEEIQKYQISLFNSSSQIWEFLNNKDDLSKVHLTKPLNQAEMLENNHKITKDLFQIRNSLEEYLTKNIENGHLDKKSFLFILSAFSYCWCEESTQVFVSKILSINKEYQKILIQCLITNPSIQVYFVSVFQEVFNDFEYKSVEELSELTLETLRKFSSLIPLSLQIILSSANYLFFNLMSPFIEFFYLFGICDPSISLFYPNKKEELITSLQQFFEGDEGSFYLECLTRTTPICIVPTEMSMRDIDTSYIPCTFLTPEIYNVQNPCFIPLSITNSSNSFLNQKKKSFSMTVINLLLDCELICLENDDATPLECFNQLVSLTSFLGDPLLEQSLEDIESFLNENENLTVQDICNIVNEEIDKGEISEEQNPILSVAKYSKQSALIKKLTEKNNSIIMNAQDFVHFFKLQKELENISSPTADKFVDAFMKIKDEKHCKSSNQLKNLFSILLHQTQYLESKNYSEEDQKLHDSIECNKNDILNNINQDYLDIYKKDPSLLSLFFNEFELSFKTKIPLTQVEHINNGFTILTCLLKEQGLNDIGADQIVPFGILATVLSNPMGLATTKNIFCEILQPLVNNNSSPIPSQQEYSFIQFISTLQFLEEKYFN